jgi:hypothetical protein
MPAPRQATRLLRRLTSCAMSRRVRANGRLVAGVFRIRLQRSLEPPGNRMKPENAAVDVRQNGHQRIAPPDVRHLVRENRTHPSLAPAAPGRRQQNDGRNRADGHRCHDGRRLQQNRRPRKLGQQGTGIAVNDAASIASDACRLSVAPDAPCQQREHDGAVEPERQNGCGSCARADRGLTGRHVAGEARNWRRSVLAVRQRPAIDSRETDWFIAPFDGGQRDTHRPCDYLRKSDRRSHVRERRHQQHGGQDRGPGPVPQARVAQPEGTENQRDRRCHQGAPDRRFHNRAYQNAGHDDFLTFRARRSSSRADTIRSSTMPTRNCSTDPAQNRSMRCCTARAARPHPATVAR